MSPPRYRLVVKESNRQDRKSTPLPSNQLTAVHEDKETTCEVPVGPFS